MSKRVVGGVARGEKGQPFFLFPPEKGSSPDGVLGQGWGSGPRGTGSNSNQEDGKQMEPGNLQTVEPRRGGSRWSQMAGNGQEASGLRGYQQCKAGAWEGREGWRLRRALKRKGAGG